MNMSYGLDAAPDVAPLCPAGHLPHMGGDWLSSIVSPVFGDWRNRGGGPISPHVGEMSGRTEGGAKERAVRGARP